MRDSDIKRALDATANVPDPSATAPPFSPFLLDLEGMEPEEAPTIDPTPPRQFSSDPTPSEEPLVVLAEPPPLNHARPVTVHSPLLKWGLAALLFSIGSALLLCAVAVALFGVLLLS